MKDYRNEASKLLEEAEVLAKAKSKLVEEISKLSEKIEEGFYGLSFDSPVNMSNYKREMELYNEHHNSAILEVENETIIGLALANEALAIDLYEGQVGQSI